MSEAIIGVDLGGTQMRAARFDTSLEIEDRIAEPTLAHEGQARVLERLAETIARVLPSDRSSVMGIGICAPGPINPHTGIIYSPPNLPGWVSVPLRDEIQNRLGITTYLGNDANVAALAEATSGIARNYKYVMYLTISTGIGSGIVDNGRLILGSQGLGAEAGHMVIMVGDRVSTLEKEAAGPAIARKVRAQLEAGEKSMITEMINGDLSAVTAQVVGEAAQLGDALAVSAIRHAGFVVGLGIVTLMHLFNPQIVVVGGGVTHTGELLFEPMREAVRKYTLDPAYCDNVPIVQPALGDNVALIGAAALVSTRGGTHS